MNVFFQGFFDPNLLYHDEQDHEERHGYQRSERSEEQRKADDSEDRQGGWHFHHPLLDQRRDEIAFDLLYQDVQAQDSETEFTTLRKACCGGWDRCNYRPQNRDELEQARKDTQSDS